MSGDETVGRNRDAAVEPALLFDMDGVLLRGRGTDPAVYATAADAAIDDLGLEPSDAQRAVLQAYRYTDSIADACAALGVDPDDFWARRESHASRIAHDRFRAGERDCYDDVDAIRAIADRATLGLVSNNRHETVAFVVDHFGFDGVFDAVRGRDPTIAGYRRRKPDPGYLEDVLETLGATDAVYVGDRPTDVEAAREAGIDSAFLRRPHNRDDPLPAEATYELESLADLPSVLDATD